MFSVCLVCFCIFLLNIDIRVVNAYFCIFFCIFLNISANLSLHIFAYILDCMYHHIIRITSYNLQTYAYIKEYCLFCAASNVFLALDPVLSVVKASRFGSRYLCKCIPRTNSRMPGPNPCRWCQSRFRHNGDIDRMAIKVLYIKDIMGARS